MKVYTIENQKTKEQQKFAENNKKGMALLFYTALANWEMNGSKCWKEYCEKYTDTKSYDKHLEDLERKERQEFYSNLVENNNTYNMQYKIIKVEEKEQEREL